MAKPCDGEESNDRTANESIRKGCISAFTFLDKRPAAASRHLESAGLPAVGLGFGPLLRRLAIFRHRHWSAQSRAMAWGQDAPPAAVATAAAAAAPPELILTIGPLMLTPLGSITTKLPPTCRLTTCCPLIVMLGALMLDLVSPSINTLSDLR